jgi:hypothetical protein
MSFMPCLAAITGAGTMLPGNGILRALPGRQRGCR